MIGVGRATIRRLQSGFRRWLDPDSKNLPSWRWSPANIGEPAISAAMGRTGARWWRLGAVTASSGVGAPIGAECVSGVNYFSLRIIRRVLLLFAMYILRKTLILHAVPRVESGAVVIVGDDVWFCKWVAAAGLVMTELGKGCGTAPASDGPTPDPSSQAQSARKTRQIAMSSQCGVMGPRRPPQKLIVRRQLLFPVATSISPCREI